MPQPRELGVGQLQAATMRKSNKNTLRIICIRELQFIKCMATLDERRGNLRF